MFDVHLQRLPQMSPFHRFQTRAVQRLKFEGTCGSTLGSGKARPGRPRAQGCRCTTLGFPTVE